MSKSLFIAEKPSVAAEFAKALKCDFTSRNGYKESERYIVTWCVGHLVALSYPEVYDEKLRKWSFDTIPFIPDTFLYQVIDGVKSQFFVVKNLLNRDDVETIYVCTDSGREGEYIYRLVEQEALSPEVLQKKHRKRVWIDSQTEEEILRGIREAKDLSEYDHLSDAAYLRAKVDYLMGINFSRALSLKFSYPVKTFLNRDKAVISVGRVMTCVLGIVVNREWEIRNFQKVPFYRILTHVKVGEGSLEAEWKCQEKSIFYGSPNLYKDNGFRTQETAQELVEYALQQPYLEVDEIEKKKETKNPPLLYNLAELQNDCAKYFKISPNQTLEIMQELYEKKLTTYPRTDARVLSSAVAKEIHRNLNGLLQYQPTAGFAKEILEKGLYKKLASSRYVNDKQITDHYCLIPTGQGIGVWNSLSPIQQKVYDLVVRRFLSIFYTPAVYQKVNVVLKNRTENFHAGAKVLKEQGYLKVLENSVAARKSQNEEEQQESNGVSEEAILALKKGDLLQNPTYSVKAGETTPPKRYNSGTMILTMENAGQFIEDEDLRSQIKGSGIGTSATRAEILNKLVHIGYLDLNKKTQILTPTLLGELVYEVVNQSISPLLNPSLTASWEKGLTQVAEGKITSDEYMDKLSGFIMRRTDYVRGLRNQYSLNQLFQRDAEFYKKTGKKGSLKQEK